MSPRRRTARSGAALPRHDARLGTGVDVRFVVSGGSEAGLGHVMRCATIAAEARARGLRVGFALRGDDAAACALARELPGVDLVPWSDPPSALRDARAIVLDTRDPIAGEIALARSAGVRSLVLDRTDHLDDADWTVLPVLHAPRIAHPHARQGGRWCVLAPAFRGLGVPPYPDGRDGVLVTLGGADPLDLTSRVAAELREALDDADAPARLRVDFVIGPAFAARERMEQALRAQGWRVHAPLSRRAMCALMSRARFAIVGFGTTLSELAFMGVPALTLTHHESDLPDAARLEALGIARCGGFGGRFDASRFHAALRTSLFDDGWCRRASGRARALLGDGAGAGRIVDLLFAPRRRCLTGAFEARA